MIIFGVYIYLNGKGWSIGCCLHGCIYCHVYSICAYTRLYSVYGDRQHVLSVCVDEAIGTVQKACEENGYVMLVTSDHGNAERMLDEMGMPVTKHTTFRGKAIVCLHTCQCYHNLFPG